METWICSLRGHVTPAAKVAALRPDDNGIGVESHDGRRFARCVRCDAWTVHSLPIASPAEPELPPVPYDSMHIPRRGKPLREAVIMRLIAINRGAHSVLFSLLAIALATLEFRLPGLQSAAANLRDRLQDPLENIGPDASHDWATRQLDRILDLKTSGIKILLITAIVYAVIEGVEAVGLWRERRWAEYLTVIATAGFLPFEVHELTKRVTVLRVVALVVNVALLVWLVWKKGLFNIGPNAHHHDEPINRFELFWPRHPPEQT